MGKKYSKEQAQELFSSINKDGSGHITRDDLKKYFEDDLLEEGVKEVEAATVAEKKTSIGKILKDAVDEIKKDMEVGAKDKVMGMAGDIDRARESLVKTFEAAIGEYSKSLAENEKVRMADEIEQRVKNIVEKADKNEDGQVSIKEFKDLMKNNEKRKFFEQQTDLKTPLKKGKEEPSE